MIVEFRAVPHSFSQNQPNAGDICCQSAILIGKAGGNDENMAVTLALIQKHPFRTVLMSRATLILCAAASAP